MEVSGDCLAGVICMLSEEDVETLRSNDEARLVLTFDNNGSLKGAYADTPPYDRD